MNLQLKIGFLFINFLASLSLASPNSENIKTTVEALPSCGNFIRYDNKNVYTGFGPYWTSSEKPRVPAGAKVLVAPLVGGARTELITLDSAIDLFTENSTAYILTYSGIEEWDLNQNKRVALYPTQISATALDDQQHAQAFARYNNKFIIAHGRLGVSFFDLKSKKITNMLQLTNHQGSLESMAKGVSVSGRYAYVILDSYTLVGPDDRTAFRGMIVIDMETEQIVSQLGGMDPGASSVVADESRVIVSFYGQPLWKYSTESLLGTKLPAPLKRFWKFPVEGRALGAASMDDRYYYTCFSRLPKAGEGPHFIKVPLAFDRQALSLD